jgi:multimeric flavodoxin WrbA
MGKVLGIVGSPRRNGNTHVLIEQVLAGAAARGASGETLLLGELTIRECDGCHACWAGKPCPKHDDMNEVYPQIAESSAIVLGTPVYWYGPTALMKAFLDRFCHFNCPESRKLVRGKAAALVVPFEEPDPQAASPLVAMFERSFAYLEMELVDTLLVPGVTRLGEVRDRQDVMGRARRLGEELGERLAGG